MIVIGKTCKPIKVDSNNEHTNIDFLRKKTDFG